ncbi:Hypothetical protein A7982_06160 [Minicystis rosea]|nr:Hypothetical protein A7982_06160 [Minicystis rosea]
MALMVVGLVDVHWWAVRYGDPAPIFYTVGAVGLALRLFWARYLAICFAAAVLSVRVLCDGISEANLFALGIVVLLSGRSMQSLFEARAARLNHWATELDRRVTRLRMLFVAQAVAIGLIFGWGRWLSPGAVPLVGAAGLTIFGLVFQRTWGVLAIVPVIGLEACLAVRSTQVRLPLIAFPSWCFTAVLSVACAVSLAVIAPLLWALGQKLRGPAREDDPSTLA